MQKMYQTDRNEMSKTYEFFIVVLVILGLMGSSYALGRIHSIVEMNGICAQMENENVK